MHVSLGWVGRWVGRQTCEAEVAVEVLMPWMRGKGWRECFYSHFCQINDCMVWLLRFGHSYIKHHSDLDAEYGQSLQLPRHDSNEGNLKWFEVNVLITWEDLREIWRWESGIRSQLFPTFRKSDWGLAFGDCTKCKSKSEQRSAR